MAPFFLLHYLQNLSGIIALQFESRRWLELQRWSESIWQFVLLKKKRNFISGSFCGHELINPTRFDQKETFWMAKPKWEQSCSQSHYKVHFFFHYHLPATVCGVAFSEKGSWKKDNRSSSDVGIEDLETILTLFCLWIFRKSHGIVSLKLNRFNLVFSNKIHSRFGLKKCKKSFIYSIYIWLGFFLHVYPPQ